MERLFIKVDSNNTPINHPIWESNLRALLPEFNFDSPFIPNGYKLFERVLAPPIGIYEKFKEEIGEDIAIAFPHNGLEYKYFPDEDKVKDVWHVRDLTDDEKKAKQDIVKDLWEVEGYPSWIWNEAKCQYEPPKDHPSNGKLYEWKESTQEWIEYPREYDNAYAWDRSKEEWVIYTE